MIKAAFVGWRGLVGSVLLERMQEENDFKRADFTFFSNSAFGKEAPKLKDVKSHTLKNASLYKELLNFDIIISCQGSEYTKKIHKELNSSSWNGYWIDAASHLRMQAESTLVLDPVNKEQIEKALQKGQKAFIGANCTVSLMMLAIHGLLKEDLIEWVHTASYQAISGGGSAAIEALFNDLKLVSEACSQTQSSILSKIESAHKALRATDSSEEKSQKLGANVLPWIDSREEGGSTREEAKGARETNKILGRKTPISIDGTCVRVPVLRSHSQTLTLKLKKDLSLSDLEDIIKKANNWVKLTPNTKEETLRNLTPRSASGTLNILVGRVRKLQLPGPIFEVFTVGDQLLWGAAEPLRRCFNLIVDFLEKRS